MKNDDDLDSILSGGWDALNEENAKAARVKNAREEHAYATRIARPFLTQDGRTALQMMREVTVDATTWNPELGANAVHNGFWREGQNSIVRWIEKCIEIAQAGPPDAPAPERPVVPPRTPAQKGRRK